MINLEVEVVVVVVVPISDSQQRGILEVKTVQDLK